MERVERECGRFLAENINVETCLELRNTSGFSRLPDMVEKVDRFISAEMESLTGKRSLMSLPRLEVEVLHSCREEIQASQSKSLCKLVLDWVHAQW